MKIAILGYSGSGKSTLARKLGDFYGIPVLHLDQVQFLPGWEVRDPADSRGIVRAFLEQESWIIDGNYSGFLQEERLEQADQILLLTFSRAACLLRVWRRYRIYRGRTREDMAAGCPEKLDAEFLRWVLWEGRTSARRRHYRDVVQRYPDKSLRLKNQRQLDRFLATLS